MSAIYETFIRKKSKNASRTTGLVAVIKMIHVRSIKIHRFFYQPQAQNSCVKIKVLLCTARNCCNVVYAGNQFFHRIILSKEGRFLSAFKFLDNKYQTGVYSFLFHDGFNITLLLQ